MSRAITYLESYDLFVLDQQLNSSYIPIHFGIVDYVHANWSEGVDHRDWTDDEDSMLSSIVCWQF